MAHRSAKLASRFANPDCRKHRLERHHRSGAKRTANTKRGTRMFVIRTLSGNIWLNEYRVKYILYCRKSTDEKDKQVLSIEAQIAELQEFAIRERLEIVATFSESRTAKSPGRSIFKEVLTKIESGEADAILSWHPDRLARNSIDGGYLIYLLDTGKLLDLKFPSFWFDNTPQGKFMLNLAFGQSKYYVDNLSENVKRGLRQKIRNGVWPSQAPYGYLNNKITKGIELDQEKSKVVKNAFEIFAVKVHNTDIELVGEHGMDAGDVYFLAISFSYASSIQEIYYIGE